MSQSNPVADDLRFVRNAVERRDQRGRAPAATLIVWTLYSVVCIPAYDYAPSHGGMINLVGWLAAAFLSFLFGKRAAKQSGQFDRAQVVQLMWHWYGGVALLLVACIGMGWVNPNIGELPVSQMSVILVGFLYFTAGVHMPEAPFMRWAGPVIVLAGIGVGLLRHLRWTAIGAVFGLCLMMPLLFSTVTRRRAA